MTTNCIEKTKSHIDYKRLLPDIFSLANIGNDSYDKSDE